ncbi:hypothetical protein NMG60_11009549 [Bertholletia excelsa]
MLTDSITNATIPMAANAKDFAKKKKANRSAKLKQCKLDARREQWLSLVKNKGRKEESDSPGGLCAVSVLARDERERSMENLGINPRGQRNEGPIHLYSDSDSPSNSPTSHTSSVLGSNASGTNFTGSSRSGSSSSSCSGGSCSGSINGEDEEGDDACLDDWEAVADALAASDDKRDRPIPSSEPPAEPAKIATLDSSLLAHQPASGIEILKPKPERVEKVLRAPPNCRAWKPDDAFRPQSLPNLSKQLSFPLQSSRGGSAWGCKNVISAPSSCPICCEDLDLTDSSFLPCSCGFRLCLFCHKRIIEEDGRCPGCRKRYDHEPNKGEAFRLARSCSMITRRS